MSGQYKGRSRGLRLAGLLRPLTDGNGVAYDHVPCQDNPPMWDEEAPETDKQAAATLCRICPAIKQCKVRRRQLGAKAEGVWAGRIIRRSTEDAQADEPATFEIFDPQVATWAASAGVMIPATRRKVTR